MTEHPFSSFQQEEGEGAEDKGARSKTRWSEHRQAPGRAAGPHGLQHPWGIAALLLCLRPLERASPCPASPGCGLWHHSSQPALGNSPGSSSAVRSHLLLSPCSTFVPSLVCWINRFFFWLLFSSRVENIAISYKIFNYECRFKQHVQDWAIPM